MVIKWVQDHIKNDDLKRIQTLREIRKCFARQSTSGKYFTIIMKIFLTLVNYN